MFKFVFIGVTLMAFAHSSLFSQSGKKYHNLSAAPIVSGDYEIIRLVKGKIDDVFYNSQNNNLLAQAGGYLWKIDKDGFLIDILEKPGNIYRSGMIFTEDYYIDWVFTGDKSQKKYSKILDASKISKSEFLNYLHQAEIAEFDIFHSSGDKNGKSKCFLKIKDQVIIIDIAKYKEQIISNSNYLSRYHEIGWEDTDFEGFTRKSKNKLEFMQNSINYDYNWEDKSGFIFANDFAKEFYYYERGFGEWIFERIVDKAIPVLTKGRMSTAYWFGTGYFQLNHNSEKFFFKNIVPYEDNKIEFHNLSIYRLPQKQNQDFKLIRLDYRLHYETDREKIITEYYEKDVGLYALRKRKKPLLQNETRQWRPVFSGAQASAAVSGDITFFNNNKRPYLLDKIAVAENYQELPQKISIHWRGKFKKYSFKLVTLENSFWFHFPKMYSTLSFEIVFDKNEISEAFQKLQSSSQAIFKKKNTPLLLELHFEKAEDGTGKLSVHLRDNKESLELKKINVIPDTIDKIHFSKDQIIKYEKSLLTTEFEEALKNSRYLSQYLAVAEKIATNSKYPKEYAHEYSYFTVKLMLLFMKDKDYKTAETVMYHYIDKLLPRCGLHEKASDIASNGLALAILTQNDKLSKIIFEKFLGEAYDIAKEKNEILLFNLACYYSLKGEKKSMLTAIKTSIKNGKDPDDFRKDADFKAFHEDKDFLKALETKSLKSAINNKTEHTKPTSSAE